VFVLLCSVKGVRSSFYKVDIRDGADAQSNECTTHAIFVRYKECLPLFLYSNLQDIQDMNPFCVDVYKKLKYGTLKSMSYFHIKSCTSLKYVYKTAKCCDHPTSTTLPGFKLPTHLHLYTCESINSLYKMSECCGNIDAPLHIPPYPPPPSPPLPPPSPSPPPSPPPSSSSIPSIALQIHENNLYYGPVYFENSTSCDGTGYQEFAQLPDRFCTVSTTISSTTPLSGVQIIETLNVVAYGGSVFEFISNINLAGNARRRLEEVDASTGLYLGDPNQLNEAGYGGDTERYPSILGTVKCGLPTNSPCPNVIFVNQNTVRVDGLNNMFTPAQLAKGSKDGGNPYTSVWTSMVAINSDESFMTILKNATLFTTTPMCVSISMGGSEVFELKTTSIDSYGYSMERGGDKHVIHNYYNKRRIQWNDDLPTYIFDNMLECDVSKPMRILVQTLAVKVEMVAVASHIDFRMEFSPSI